MNNKPIRVLFVDNQVDAREWLAERMRKHYKLEVDTASDGNAAIEMARQASGNYEVVLMDLRLENKPDGIETMKIIQGEYPEIETIIITGYADVEDGIRALQEGAYKYVSKPFNHDEIVLYIRSAAETRRLIDGLYLVSHVMTSSLDPLQVAEEMYRHTSRLIHQMDVFYIATYDSSKDCLDFLVMYDAGNKVTEAGRVLSNRDNWGLTGLIIKDQKPLFIEDLPIQEQDLPVRSKSINPGKSALSYIGLPLISNDKLIGVMSVQSYETHAFNDNHKRLIQAIANQAAVGIDNALLHQQVERRLLVLSKLYETLTAIRSTLDLDYILNLIVKNLQELFDLNICTIGLFDSGRTMIDIVAEEGLGMKISRSLDEIPTPLLEKITKAGEPVIIPNLDMQPILKKVLGRDDLNSFVALPLKGKDELLGILIMISTSAIDLSDEQQSLLMALSDQAAIAIENADLHQKTGAWARQLEVLDKVALDIASKIEIKSLLRTIIRGATGLLVGAGGNIYLFAESEKDLCMEASFGTPAELEGIHIGNDQGIIARVLKSSGSFTIPNPSTNISYNEWPDRLTIFDRFNLSAVVGAPILSGERLLGVLTVHDTKPGRAFSLAEQNLLLRFGMHAGAALENARILDELSKLYEEQRAADDVTQALIGVFDYDQLLEKILNVLHTGLGYYACAVLLKDEATQKLYLERSLNYPEALKDLSLEIGGEKGIAGLVVSTGEVINVPSVKREPRYIPGIPDGGSEMAVPLIVGGKIIGVLDVESTEEDAFGERDERILSKAATVIAVGIEKARLLDEANRKRSRLELLASLSKTVVGSETLQAGLQIVAENMVKASFASLCHILLFTKDGRYLRTHAAYPMPSDDGIRWNPMIGEVIHLLPAPLLKRIRQELGPYTFRRGDKEAEEVLDLIEHCTSLEDSLEESLVIPLKTGPKNLGVCLISKTKRSPGKPFTAEEIEFTATLAAQVAVAVDKTRVYELERERSTTLKQLNEMGNAIASTLTLGLDELLKLIVTYGKEMLCAEVCSLFLVKRQGYLSLEADYGSPPNASGASVELKIEKGKGTGLTGYIAAEGEVFNKFGDELHHHPATRKEGRQEHIPSGYCKSLLAIPLKRKSDDAEELIGLIKVENKMDRRGRVDPLRGFDDEDVAILKTLASYAITAIQNVELFVLSETLQKATKVVNSTLDFDKVLREVLAQLKNLVPFDTASILLRNGSELNIVACDGFEQAEEEKVLQLSFPLDPKFPNTKVINSRKPLLLDDVLNCKYRHFVEEADTFRTHHIRSWLGIPLAQGNVVVGLMSMESGTPSRFTKKHKDYGSAFSDQIASAIVNAKLHKSAASFNLLGVLQDKAKTQSFQTVLRGIVRGALDPQGIIGADIAIIYLYDPIRGSLIGHPVYEGRLNFPDKINGPFGPGSAIYRLLEKKVPHTADVTANDRIFDGDFVRRENVNSAAGIPLLVGKEAVGVMFVNYLSLHTFKPEEVTLIKLFAQQAATAIQYARQYQTVSERLEVAANATVYMSAMSAWAHDASNETYVLWSDASSLPDYIEAPNPKALEILERIRNKAQRIASLMPNAPGDLNHKEEINLARIFESVLSRYEGDLAAKEISCQFGLGDFLLVKTNEWLVREAINHLIQNACKAMNPGGKLSISSKVVGNRAFIEMSNTGRKIPPELQEQIFKRRVHGQNKTGAGIGLLLTKIYFNACGGDISLDHSDDHCTTFVFYLPLSD